MASSDDVAALAALAEPLRRRLFLAVAAAPEGLSRDEAAASVGAVRATAAFHLDKLAELGLLDVEYRRPPGRSGPGAGRPAKIYRRRAQDLAVSVPARRYDVAARILADATDAATSKGTPLRAELSAAARELGLAVGATPTRSAEGTATLSDVVTVLDELGYEPERDDDEVRLRNCPFHALAQRHRGLVCGMNLDLVQGVLDSLGVAGVAAELRPAEGSCCVRVSARAS